MKKKTKQKIEIIGKLITQQYARKGKYYRIYKVIAEKIRPAGRDKRSSRKKNV